MSLLLKYIELNWIEINFTGKTTNFKPFYGSGPSVDGIRAETGKLRNSKTNWRDGLTIFTSSLVNLNLVFTIYECKQRCVKLLYML